MIDQILFWSLIGAVAYVYFGYPLFLVTIGNFRRDERQRGFVDDEWPSVSLVVVAYNEEEVIREKIENSLALDYPKDKLEVVIASDASTDRTDDIAREYAGRGVVLHRRPQRGSQTGAQNYAAPRARGEVIVFTDANSMYEKDTVRNLVRNFADPRVGCVIGRLEYGNAGETAVSLGEGLYRRYDDFLKAGQSRSHALLLGIGAVYAVRKSVYTPVDPRHDHDTMVPLRCAAGGFRVVYEREAVAWEEANTEAGHEFNRKIRTIVRDMWTFLDIKVMLPHIWIAFNLVSNKIIRWGVIFLLAGALVGNFFLLRETLYQVTLVLQLAFYLSALFGFLFRGRVKGLIILRVPFYFCLVNVASLVAVARVLRGQRVITWKPREL